jgi:CubicO group peptidase (beta-lactamase class C family)
MHESRRSFLQLAAGALAARAAEAADYDPSAEELIRMQGVARVFMSAHSVPGLSMAVAREGQVIYERGFGLA